MKNFLFAFAVASLFATGAHATVTQTQDCACDGTPLTGSFAVTIWSANTPWANGNSSNQQALPTNPIAIAADLVSKGVYTGAINFSYDPSRFVTPTISGFLNSSNGNYTGTGNTNVLLSSSNYDHATLIEFSFTIAAPLTNITISHDDGVSLFAANDPTHNLLPSGAAAPTTEADTTLASLAAGTYNLWYAEVNGVPADLCIDPANGGTATTPTATPEPASIALLGMGLATVGFVRRRRAA